MIPATTYGRGEKPGAAARWVTGCPQPPAVHPERIPVRTGSDEPGRPRGRPEYEDIRYAADVPLATGPIGTYCGTGATGVAHGYAPRVDADELAAAWAELERARPTGWMVGQPYFHDEVGAWEQYAYDPAERPVGGKRPREWTAIAPTDVEVVVEMTRCLRELGEGRWPR